VEYNGLENGKKMKKKKEEERKKKRNFVGDEFDTTT
jgi:hypothetical protein